eukprot:m.5706 g.5706  ORF g.5706 m.5706 type:complete len:877 (-) comp2457_c0_seq1:83-2713(-)
MSEIKYLQGTVKSVLSGDTVVIRGEPRGGPPPEKTLSFAGITAPRLGRRPNNTSSEVLDEPCAWDSREFVRRKIVGKKIKYFIEYSVPSGRDFGHIVIDPNTVREENITLSLVSAGLAKIRDNSKGGGEFFETLKTAQAVAESNKLGLFAEGADKNVRHVAWNVENIRALVDKSKFKPQKAVVEHIRDASTLRVLLLPTFNYITISLTGLKSPGFKKSADGKETADAFAVEAKYFVESRLLHRDIEVILEGVSGTNVLGTVLLDGKNLSEHLLKSGYAKIVDWSIGSVTKGAKAYREAQKEAQGKKMRIWKSYTPKASGVVESDKKFKAKVMEISTTDSLVIERGGVSSKIFLASIRQPRRERVEGEQGRAPRFYEHPYGFEAREFLRKKLVHQTVDISTDYIQPANNGYPAKTCCTVRVGGVNVAEALVSKGFATVIMYKEDDENRSSCYDALLAAETKAKKSEKGIYSKREVPVHRFAEVSGKTQADKFLHSMQRKGKVTGVVEFASSGSRLRVFIPQETCIVSVVIAGVSCPRTGRKGEADEPFAKEALEFTKRTCLQREVELEVEDTDKNGNFVSHLLVDNENLGVLLVQAGFATLHGTYVRYQHTSDFENAEQVAKKKNLNLYKDYEAKEKAIADAQAIKDQEKLEQKKAASVEVIVTEVPSTNTVYIQTTKNDVIRKIMSDVSGYCSACSVKDYVPQVGSLCSAEFSLDRHWYRAKVLEEVDGGYHVLYVDFGNEEVVSKRNILPLPESCKSIKPQARLVTLAGLGKVPSDWGKEALEVVKETVLDKSFVCEELYDNEGAAVVSLTTEGSPIDVSEDLLSIGYGVVSRFMPKFLSEKHDTYKKAQQTALHQRMGIFMYGDVTEDEHSNNY